MNNDQITRRLRHLLMAAASGWPIASSAYAQSATPAPQTQQAPPTVAEVIVTAQRRAERLEDVPMSVTAVTAQNLADAGIGGLRDIGELSAGVNFNFSGAFTEPSIRGVSSLSVGIGFENNVSVYVDGYYVPDTVTVNADLANVAGVEVLKGPQGTLWGRNATGGAILITTKGPSRVLTGDFEAGYGNLNDRFVSGFIAGPISDRVRFSLSAYEHKNDGYITLLGPNGAPEPDPHAAPLTQESYRFKLQADVTSKLKATLGLNYGYSDDARGLYFTYHSHVLPILPPSPPRASAPDTASANYPTTVTGTTYEATLSLEYATPIGALSSYTGYARRPVHYSYDVDGSATLAPGNAGGDRLWVERTFQEMVDYHVTAFRRLDVNVGGQYFWDSNIQNGGQSLTNGVFNQALYVTLTDNSFAGYVDATYHLTDALSIDAGVRYTSEKKDISYALLAPTTGANLIPPGRGTVSFPDTTSRASIRYEFLPRTNVYFTFSQGFRSGGWNPTPPASPAQLIPFQPEKLDAYEVGVKTAQKFVRFDIAGFYYNYTNLQVAETVTNTSLGGLINIITNAPLARIYGVDADADVQLIDHLDVHAGLEFLHARYINFADATGVGLNAATGLNVTQVQNWSGLPMARAPDFSANLGGDYKITGVAGGVLLLSLNFSYMNSSILSNPTLYGPLAGPALANQQRYVQGGYGLLNGQLRWTDGSNRYSVELWSDNMTNKHYLIRDDGLAFGDFWQAGAPATYGVRLGYKF